MGANIGTSVTSTLVAMGQMDDPVIFERAFAGGTVHDMFNLLAVAVMLPLELITGFLYELTKAMTPDDVAKGEKWEGPLKVIVSPLVNRMIYVNKKVAEAVSQGKTTCEAAYASNTTTGLIKCSDDNGCPVFYDAAATQADDMASATVCLIISLFVLVTCLYMLVKTLLAMLAGVQEKMLRRATTYHPIISMAVGTGVTILVQSSSITTSLLTPLVGLDIISLESVFPLTLGANIGTTVTALLASLVSDKPAAVQIALCHLFFNISGILFWYPLPMLRQIPLNLARRLGHYTRIYRWTCVIYIVGVFVAIPAVLLGISEMIMAGKAWAVMGSIILVILFLVALRFFYWLKRENGFEYISLAMTERQERSQYIQELPALVKKLRQQIAELQGDRVNTNDLNKGAAEEEEEMSLKEDESINKP